jgi:hypothetical protein
MVITAIIGILTLFNIFGNLSHNNIEKEEKISIGVSIGLFLASLIINLFK